MTLREFKGQLVKTINDSKLAIDVVEVVLEGLLAEVHLMADRAYAEAAQESEATAQKEDNANELDEGAVR